MPTTMQTISDRTRAIMDTDPTYVVDVAKLAASVAAGESAQSAMLGALVARVWTRYPRDGAGRLTVVVADYSRDFGDRVQTSHAGGFGYDKRTAALDGLTVGGVKLGDHCDSDGDPRLADLCAARGWAILGNAGH